MTDRPCSLCNGSERAQYRGFTGTCQCVARKLAEARQALAAAERRNVYLLGVRVAADDVRSQVGRLVIECVRGSAVQRGDGSALDAACEAAAAACRAYDAAVNPSSTPEPSLR